MNDPVANHNLFTATHQIFLLCFIQAAVGELGHTVHLSSDRVAKGLLHLRLVEIKRREELRELLLSGCEAGIHILRPFLKKRLNRKTAAPLGKLFST